MPFPLVPFLTGLAANVLPGLIGGAQQKSSNMSIARFQAEANERYLDKYNEYNTPANQMKRFKDAGLNPHLVYGQGSPGNQSAPLQYPDIQKVDYQQMWSQIIPTMNQTRMTESQVNANNAKTNQTAVLTELNRLQIEVLKKNPLLDEAGFKATIDSLKAAAAIKNSEATIVGQNAKLLTQTQEITRDGEYFKGTAAEYKLWKEMDLLDQKFRLNSLDGKLKAEVLTSKEFQNVIAEIQARWMRDAEVTPQHFYELIRLILSKSF